VSEKTVADSMRRQGLVARRIKRRNGLTRQDRTAPKFGDLLRRDSTAGAPNRRWVGDMTEIPTAAGKLYLATVIDLYSRRLLGAATGLHPDGQLACEAIKMAVAARGGPEHIGGVIFHTDRGLNPPPTPPTSSPPCADHCSPGGLSDRNRVCLRLRSRGRGARCAGWGFRGRVGSGAGSAGRCHGVFGDEGG
jgi:transposase InsO family protein